LLDRSWLESMTTPVEPAPATRGGPVSLVEHRRARGR
jgi:hypothetical protein